MSEHEMSIRLECVRLAVAAAQAHQLNGKSVAGYAAEIYMFVRGDTAPALAWPVKTPTSGGQTTAIDRATVIVNEDQFPTPIDMSKASSIVKPDA